MGIAFNVFTILSNIPKQLVSDWYGCLLQKLARFECTELAELRSGVVHRGRKDGMHVQGLGWGGEGKSSEIGSPETKTLINE
jgi:hypothetical protein